MTDNIIILEDLACAYCAQSDRWRILKTEGVEFLTHKQRRPQTDWKRLGNIFLEIAEEKPFWN